MQRGRIGGSHAQQTSEGASSSGTIGDHGRGHCRRRRPVLSSPGKRRPAPTAGDLYRHFPSSLGGWTSGLCKVCLTSARPVSMISGQAAVRGCYVQATGQDHSSDGGVGCCRGVDHRGRRSMLHRVVLSRGLGQANGSPSAPWKPGGCDPSIRSTRI